MWFDTFAARCSRCPTARVGSSCSDGWNHGPAEIEFSNGLEGVGRPQGRGTWQFEGPRRVYEPLFFWTKLRRRYELDHVSLTPLGRPRHPPRRGRGSSGSAGNPARQCLATLDTQ